MATAATTSAFYIPGNGYQNVVASYSGDTAHTASVSSPVSVLGTSANFPNGFGGASGTAGLSLNGNPVIQGSNIELTTGGNFQASGFFTKSRVPVDGFTTQFNFQITNAESDGLAFVVQSNGPNAMGSAGGGIGYGLMPGHTTGASIPNSSAVLFDLHNNQGEGDNSVRIALNGNVTPGNASTGGETAPFDLTPSGIDLHSGHHFHAEIDYLTQQFPIEIAVTLTDLDTTKSVTTHFGDPGLSTTAGDSVGYVGFTAATGTETADVMIQNWIFSGVPSCYGTTLCGPIPQVSLGNGFSGSASLLQLNGGSTVSGSALQLTHDTPLEATSSYYTQQVTLSGSGYFNTDFDFTLGNGNGDGFTFVLQNQGPTAVGKLGGGLGYGPDQPNGSGNKIAQSVAVKFDLHNNTGEGINSTGIYTDGASPTIPAIDLSSSGINLHSGHTFHARLCYCDGSNLSLSITDLTDFAVFNTAFPINLVNTIGASTAYAGFTAGTGTSTDTINILNWTSNNF
jgi:Legume lectin domain